jgi:hypothetical protein
VAKSRCTAVRSTKKILLRIEMQEPDHWLYAQSFVHYKENISNVGYGVASFLIRGHRTIGKIGMTTILFITYGAALARTFTSEDLRIFSNLVSASTFPTQAMATGPLRKPPIWLPSLGTPQERATWLPIRPGNRFRISKLPPQQKFTLGSNKVGIWLAWYCRKAREIRSSLL